MTNGDYPKHQSTNLCNEDNTLLERLRMMPDPQPSNGFDARLTEALLGDCMPYTRQLTKHSENSSYTSGWAVVLEGFGKFFGSPWGKAFAFTALLIFATSITYQWFNYEEDLMKVDLLVLISYELL